MHQGVHKTQLHNPSNLQLDLLTFCAVWVPPHTCLVLGRATITWVQGISTGLGNHSILKLIDNSHVS